MVEIVDIPGDAAGRGNYSRLTEYLRSLDNTVVALSFPELERILGRSLPPSSRKHRAWWANSGHSHASAWTSAGFLVGSVDLARDAVRFVKASQTAPARGTLRAPPEGSRAAASGSSPVTPAQFEQFAEAKLAVRYGVSTHDVDLASTLVLLPCSGSKREDGSAVRAGHSVLEDLSPETARKLAEARVAARGVAAVDERLWLPAYQRYTGTLYRSSASLGAAAEKGMHLLIVSGGYGIVRATEPIGTYEAVFKRRRWPAGLIEACIAEYAARHGLTEAVAMMAASTDYGQVVRRVPWEATTIRRAVLLTPRLEGQGGAMQKVPHAIGQALDALLSGQMTDAWRSTQGVALDAQRLR